MATGLSTLIRVLLHEQQVDLCNSVHNLTEPPIFVSTFDCGIDLQVLNIFLPLFPVFANHQITAWSMPLTAMTFALRF